MLDHDLHFRPTFAELCEERGICPECGDEVLLCRCEEDAEAVSLLAAHPSGCACCASDDLDASRNLAPVRVRFPVVRRMAA